MKLISAEISQEAHKEKHMDEEDLLMIHSADASRFH